MQIANPKEQDWFHEYVKTVEEVIVSVSVSESNKHLRTLVSVSQCSIHKLHKTYGTICSNSFPIPHHEECGRLKYLKRQEWCPVCRI